MIISRWHSEIEREGDRGREGGRERGREGEREVHSVSTVVTRHRHSSKTNRTKTLFLSNDANTAADARVCVCVFSSMLLIKTIKRKPYNRPGNFLGPQVNDAPAPPLAPQGPTL